MDAPEHIAPPDPVLRTLVALNLTAEEANFRGIIANIAEDPEKPQLRELVIATICVLMTFGGLSWAIMLRVMPALKKRPDKLLADDAVAIINGGHVVIPSSESPTGVLIYDLATMRTVAEPPQGYVTTVYSVAAVWAQIEKALRS
jgi:hypothetical protein